MGAASRKSASSRKLDKATADADYQRGYDAGLKDGYAEGCQDGFDEGYSTAEAEFPYRSGDFDA